MNFSSLFSSKNKKKNNLKVVGIIDLGSAQVSGTIVGLKDGAVKNVFAETTQKISFSELPDFEHFWAMTQKSLQNVLKELRVGFKDKKVGEINLEPENFFIFLSSPFFQSQTKIIKASNPEIIKITKNYLADLIKQTDRETKFSAGDEDIVILEDKIMQTKLDGYLTTWPVGQKAKEVVLNRFLSWADKEVLVDLRNLVRAEFAKTPVIFNSFSFATYDIFKDFLPDKDFILLDTGNEITDVLIIKDNVLAEHFSFPKGKNFLIREMAKELGSVPAEVETSLNLYAADQANSKLKMRLELVLNKVSIVWQTSFKQVLVKTLETTSLPETIYLVGDDLTDNIFVQFINQTDFSEVTLSNNKLKAVFIEKLLVDGLTHLTGQDQLLTNSWLLAEALFCAKVD